MNAQDARRSQRLVPEAPVLVDNGLYQVQFDLGEPGANAHAIEAGVQVVSQRHGADGSTVAGLRYVHLPKERAQVLMRWLHVHEAGR